MELPENPTPHIHYTPVEGGSRVTPVLTDYTSGGKGNARIWHTKEQDLFFEYNQYSVQKNNLTVGCIYNRTKGIKCPAKLHIHLILYIISNQFLIL